MAPSKLRTLRSKFWLVTLVVGFALGNLASAAHLSFGAVAAQTQAAGLGATVGSGGGRAVTGRPLAAQRLQAHWSPTMPARSAQEKQAEQATLNARQRIKMPTFKPSASMPPVVERNPGPALPNPRAAPLADSDFDVELNATIPSGGVCPTDCSLTGAMETSVANDGKYLLETGNIFAAKSADNGSTWSYLDPVTLTSATHFYGDQQVLYEPSRNAMFWALTYFDPSGMPDTANQITIAVSGGTDLVNWCFYSFHSLDFGLTGDDGLIAPELEYSANFLYLTFFHVSGSTIVSDMTVARLPLSALAACGSVTPQTVHRTDTFAPMLAQGATDAMYWGSNSGPGAIGTTLTVFFWPEKSSSYTLQTKTIAAFNYLNSGSGNCASQDAAVTNWCGHISSARGTGYRSRAGYRGYGAPLISFAWVVGPTSGVSSFPSVVREYFLLANMAYQAHDYVYNANFAVAFPSLSAPVARGSVGGTFTYGGGTGSGGGAQDFYPGNFLLIEDPDTPSQPWSVNYYLPGSANIPDVGAYTGDPSRPWTPDGLHWIASGWRMNAMTMSLEPHVAIFGRGRDHNAYLLWSTSPSAAFVYATGSGTFQFSPASITVKVGTMVVWVNQTGALHTVTSTPSGPLSGMLAPNTGTYSYTFTTAGTYNYHCTIHVNMTGTVTVTT